MKDNLKASNNICTQLHSSSMLLQQTVIDQDED